MLTDDARYAAHQEANRTGGPCTVCGWRDGDGVGACFYSASLGMVTHQNSSNAVWRQLSPAQQALLAAYDSTHTELEHMLDHTGCVEALAHNGAPIRGSYRVPHACGGQFVQSLDARTWRCTGCGEERERGPLDPRACFFSHHHPAIADHSVCRTNDAEGAAVRLWYMPHTCGGQARSWAPYHITCSGCDTDIRLWDYGVDYDIG